MATVPGDLLPHVTIPNNRVLQGAQSQGQQALHPNWQVVLAVVITLVVCAVVAVALWFTLGMATYTRTASTPSLAEEQWVVVGAGVTAAAFLSKVVDRAAFVVAEAEERVGGRALSNVPPAGLVSTANPPREFGAWIAQSAPGTRTGAFLADLGVQTIPIQLISPYSFIFTRTGARVPFATIPASQYGARSASTLTQDVWTAHTGFAPDVAPAAADDLIRAQNLPPTATVPTGFGWQDVVLRGIGGNPVQYGHSLAALRVLPSTGAVRLTYASGDVQMVDGVVLTLPPQALLHVLGLPAWARDTIQSSFVTVSEGVLYATWAGGDAGWFSKAGFGQEAGVVATALPIGRMYHTATGEIRCTTTGTPNVQFWNNLLVVEGAAAAAAEVAAQLGEVFGVEVPPPANVAFRGWVDAVGFWTIGDPDKRAAVQQRLSRPWGDDAPVFWASSDLSDKPGWVEGAIESGQVMANTVNLYRAKGD
jgi:hypothetical protein